jgi:NAD(P)-dependent dehydrogenase (short-subunit alcohol dehydrogenase family)
VPQHHAITNGSTLHQAAIMAFWRSAMNRRVEARRAHNQYRLDCRQGYEGTSNTAYAASKGAVINVSKTAAQQLARHNVNVNSICPGMTRTALSDDKLRIRAQQEGVTIKDMEHRRVAAIPLKRANDPEDIAAMVVFLASAGARNITGQSFNVDGGLIPD